MEKYRHIIKFEQLPENARGYGEVILFETIFFDEDEDGNLITDRMVYTWETDPEKQRVFCVVGDDVNVIGHARNLQQALKLSLQDFQEWLETCPKRPIKVVD